jgi:hypothetical protein
MGVRAVSAPEMVHLVVLQPGIAGSDVLNERLRQVEREGYSHEHDDGLVDGQLARAASCYALGERHAMPNDFLFKGGTRREMLVKAGALILAEIERLDRAAANDAAVAP